MSSSASGQKLRRKAGLTRRGWAFAIVGILCLPIAYNLARTELLFVAWFALLLPALAFVFVRLRSMRMAVKRSFSSSVLVASHPVTVSVELSNTSGTRSAFAEWRELLPWQPFSTTPQTLRPLAPRRTARQGRSGAAELRYELLPPRRGRFEIGPFLVELKDPFGLAHSEIAIGEKREILVTPEVESLTGSGLAVSADDGSARVQQLRALASDDDLMTRNYRIGDALRRVHWRASAHYGELMVRQEEQRSHAEARIFFDTTRTGYRDALRRPEAHQPQSESFEWAVRMTASLGLHLQRSGFLVHLIETGPAQLTTLDNYDRFRESLATVSLSEWHGTSARTAQGPRTERSLGIVFAVISDADPETIDNLVTQRPQFDLAIAIIVSPRFAEIAAPLEEAGWRCIAAKADDSIEQLWRGLAPELETGHAWR